MTTVARQFVTAHLGRDAFAPFTGTDGRAWSAYVYLLELWGTQHDGHLHPDHSASQHIDCTLALNARREMLTSIAGRLAMHYPTTKERRAARARCAALINAREGK